MCGKHFTEVLCCLYSTLCQRPCRAGIPQRSREPHWAKSTRHTAAWSAQCSGADPGVVRKETHALKGHRRCNDGSLCRTVSPWDPGKGYRDDLPPCYKTLHLQRVSHLKDLSLKCSRVVITEVASWNERHLINITRGTVHVWFLSQY